MDNKNQQRNYVEIDYNELMQLMQDRAYLMAIERLARTLSSYQLADSIKGFFPKDQPPVQVDSI